MVAVEDVDTFNADIQHNISIESGYSFESSHWSRSRGSLSCSEIPDEDNRLVIVPHPTWGRSTRDGHGIKWQDAIEYVTDGVVHKTSSSEACSPDAF